MSIGVPAGSLTSRLVGDIDSKLSVLDCACWTGFAALVSTTGLWAKLIAGENKANNKSEIRFLNSESSLRADHTSLHRKPSAAETFWQGQPKPVRVIGSELCYGSLSGVIDYWCMPARKRPSANDHLQEAMALLIRNQAAFVEQIARNDQERLKLQRISDQRQLRIEEWQRKGDQRFDKIEERLPRVKIIVLQLPKAIKNESGFKSRN